MTNIKEFLINWWHWLPIVLGLFVLLAAFTAEPTEKDVTGGAGISAALLALFTASLAITEAANAGGLTHKRVRTWSIGIGTVATAYLWISGESGVHPANPSLPGLLAAIFLLGALISVIGPLVFGKWTRSQPEDPEKDNQPE